MRAIHLSSKLRRSAYRCATEMVFTQVIKSVDREFHLELAESPINPPFIHMSSRIPNGCDPLFSLKINGSDANVSCTVRMVWRQSAIS